MAWAFQEDNDALVNSSGPVNCTMTVAAGAFVVVVVGAVFPVTATLAVTTDKGDTVVADLHGDVQSGGLVSIFHIQSAVGGSTIFTATCSAGSASRVMISVSEYTGTPAASPVDVSDSIITASGTNHDMPLVTTVDNVLIVAGLITHATLAVEDATWTEIAFAGDFAQTSMIYKIVGAAGTHTPGWSTTSSDVAVITGAAFKEAVLSPQFFYVPEQSPLRPNVFAPGRAR